MKTRTTKVPLHAVRAGALVVLAALVSPAPLLAQTAKALTSQTGDTTLNSAQTLIKLMGVERTLADMFVHLVPLMADSTVGQLEANASTASLMRTMTEHARGGRGEVVGIFAQEFATEMRTVTPLLLDQTAREYAEAFSAEEIDELIAFYSSGVGEKVITLMPKLQGKMASVGQQAGMEAGIKAGERAMKRAIAELGPVDKEKK